MYDVQINILKLVAQGHPHWKIPALLMGKVMKKVLERMTLMVIPVWKALFRDSVRVALLRLAVLTISSLFLMWVRLVVLPNVSKEVRLKQEMVLNFTF